MDRSPAKVPLKLQLDLDWQQESAPMISQNLRTAIAIAVVCAYENAFTVRELFAVQITLTATEDTSLYENNVTFSNGRGEHIYVGTAQASTWTRRGLISFSLAGSGIPAGATINSVTLRLLMDKVGSSFNNETISLHRMTADWGEGNSDAESGSGPPLAGGQGILAQSGDATWQSRVVPGVAWTTPGGDFVATASASRSVARTIPAAITWTSAGMVSDVQGWLNSPATNFGWILRGDENSPTSASRFVSRNGPVAANRPMLTIDYTIPVTRIPGDVDNNGVVDLDDFMVLTANLGRTSGVDENQGDFTNDDRVGISDLIILRNNLGRTSPSPEAAVPEPATAVFSVLVAAAFFGRIAVRRRRLTG